MVAERRGNRPGRRLRPTRPLLLHPIGRATAPPLGATATLTEIWHRGVIALFLDKGLLNPDSARKILAWQHSGFSIESGTRILDQSTREALCQYLVRASISLKRIRWDEQRDTVTWSASPWGFFKGSIRRYGLSSSVSRQPVAQQTAGGQRSRKLEASHRPALARAGQLVRQEGGRRPRVFRYPEGP